MTTAHKHLSPETQTRKDQSGTADLLEMKGKMELNAVALSLHMQSL